MSRIGLAVLATYAAFEVNGARVSALRINPASDAFYNLQRFEEAMYGWNVFAFLCFLLAAATDWFDGYLARRWGVESRFGAQLDPIADKAL
ncbi:MAG: CDP-alcohol phosphatidyltransferase family protein, partial [Caulobacterales bacterium]|nr:CDP-alcohol phosphatidyltransferase family protein [Caulobacterales bacterium]